MSGAAAESPRPRDKRRENRMTVPGFFLPLLFLDWLGKGTDKQYFDAHLRAEASWFEGFDFGMVCP